MQQLSHVYPYILKVVVHLIYIPLWFQLAQ